MQLKRITKQWIDHYLECKGGTQPYQLLYQVLTDDVCEKINAAIIRNPDSEDKPVKAILGPFNPTGSTEHVNFNTSKTNRWETDSRKSHINYIILDSDWEGEFCRIAEKHPRVMAYVKNHNLGLEVPYRYHSENRKYFPDFILLVDNGKGLEDPLHLVVEIKGYRREDAKSKKDAMETYWVPGVNNLGSYGRWAFAEFRDVYEMDEEFSQKMEQEFDKMIEAKSESELTG